MTELVWVTRIYTKDFVTDFLQSLKNIIGGRLKSYEKMVDKCIEDTWTEFKKKYNGAKNLRTDIEHLTTGAILVTITGERS